VRYALRRKKPSESRAKDIPARASEVAR
jgi:hypothetical protein